MLSVRFARLLRSVSIRPRSLRACALLLLLSACGGGGGGGGDGAGADNQQKQTVDAWIAADDSAVANDAWQDGRPAKPVVVYADRSGSMAGFLDPSHKTQTDFRSVIDGLQARLRPARIYGYGTQVREVPNASLATLGDRGFYNERNTELEEVLDVVARDTAATSTHLIVGDARRSTTQDAYGQFARLREMAGRWAEQGGTFVVGVTMAPFVPVPGDPTGCHAGAAEDDTLRCPLYVFAYAAPGDGVRIAQVLAETFENVWAFPVPTAPGALLALTPDSVGAGTFETQWHAAGGTRVARFEAPAPIQAPAVLRLAVGDTSAGRGALLERLLRSEAVRTRISLRNVDAGAAGAWQELGADQGLVRRGGDGRTLHVFSQGPQAPRALYRVELRPTGVPAWLETFDADSAGDVERTFALRRLFETSKARAAEAPRLAHVYLLVR